MLVVKKTKPEEKVEYIMSKAGPVHKVLYTIWAQKALRRFHLKHSISLIRGHAHAFLARNVGRKRRRYMNTGNAWYRSKDS